jgi:valyl-tRNA synthetase
MPASGATRCHISSVIKGIIGCARRKTVSKTNTEEQDCGINGGDLAYSQADKWIVSRLNQVITSTSGAIEGYRLDHAAQEIYEFIWNEYCDCLVHSIAANASALC